MTVTLDLTPEEEAVLAAKARAKGLSLREYLQSQVRELATVPPVTIGAQIIAEWEREGIIGYRKDITDSRAYARRLRERAQTRDRD